MELIAKILDELTQKHFYGSLEFKFEHGRVVLMRKTETIKPADNNWRNNRGKDGQGKGQE
jgi:hypothetical protein